MMKGLETQSDPRGGKTLRALGVLFQGTGLFYLAAFTLNTGLLWFFMRHGVGCRFVDPGIVHVSCGKGLAGRFFDLYFLYLSPLIAPVFKLNWHRLFDNPEPLAAVQALGLGIFLGAYLFIIAASLWVLRQIVRGFVRGRKDRRAAGRSLWLLLVILLPTLASCAVRTVLIPPSFVATPVAVDIWHGVFNVPRNKLDEWSLVDIGRPAYKPDNYASALTRKWRDVPFVEFTMPPDLASGLSGAFSEIHVNPHYDVLTEESARKARERLVDFKLRRLTAAHRMPAYLNSETVINDWEIHTAPPDRDDVFPDIYVWRDPRGGVENILECTPAHSCAVKARFAWSHYECGEAACLCKKICTDYSLGTKDYDLVYSFDKKRLGDYHAIRGKILAYVAGFYRPDKP